MTSLRFALLGDPVSHSRSPRIHSELLRLSGRRGDYIALRSDVVGMEETIAAMRSGAWDGLNVTMPLKTVAADLVDTLSDEAETSRSVNTIVEHDGKLAGHSTDALVLRHAIGRPQFGGAGPIHIYGAGGTATAALAAFRERDDVVISARRAEQAAGLVNRLGGVVREWGRSPIPGSLVVNTTPLGMGDAQFPVTLLHGIAGLIDLPYGTEETAAVQWVRSQDIPYIDGAEFLVRQAIDSFEIWTGQRIDFDTVSSALRNA